MCSWWWCSCVVLLATQLIFIACAAHESDFIVLCFLSYTLARFIYQFYRLHNTKNFHFYIMYFHTRKKKDAETFFIERNTYNFPIRELTDMELQQRWIIFKLYFCTSNGKLIQLNASTHKNIGNARVNTKWLLKPFLSFRYQQNTVHKKTQPEGKFIQNFVHTFFASTSARRFFWFLL